MYHPRAMFILSKLVGLILDPGNLILLLLVPGALLSFTRQRAFGRGLTLAAALLAVCVAVVPMGQWLTAALENRFPVPPLPQRVDGIVVLGGVIDQFLTAERGQTALNSAAERLTGAIDLARRFPQSKIIFSGGSGSVFDQSIREADAALPFFAAMGLDPARVILERQSRNTLENARFAREIARPAPDEVWLLVTSAIHMPRSVAAFRAVDWTVLPYPVDYQTGRAGPLAPPSLGGGIASLNNALHEWVGLISYRVLGHSERLLPAPPTHD